MHCACRRLALLVRAAEKVMHGRKGHCVLLVGDWAEAYGATNVASRLYAATANRTSRGPAAAIRPTSAQESTLPESVVSASAVTGQMRSQRFALVSGHLPICVFDPRIVCDRLARNDNVVDVVRWAQISSPRERAALQLDINR
jgi:hypothetical protein